MVCAYVDVKESNADWTIQSFEVIFIAVNESNALLVKAPALWKTVIFTFALLQRQHHIRIEWHP